jgi:transcriptional regulator with XRE-family HTH domain
MAIDGAAVRILREKDGSSRTQFASRIGISMEYLCDIESGRRTLKRNPGLIKKIAETLNVPTSMVEYREVVA